MSYTLRRLALGLVIVGGAAYLLSGLVQDVDERGFDRAVVVVVSVAVALASVIGLALVSVAAALSLLRRRRARLADR